jgi:hydroxymethylglutaryl-CoA lyase
MNTNIPRRVLIREVGPREGFQNIPTVVPTDRKLELITLLADAGLTQIEVTSFVRPDKVPQLADAEDLVRHLPERRNTSWKALYLNQKGFERAEATGKLSNEGWLYTSPSETFLRENTNSSPDKGINDIPGWCSLFRSYGKSVYGLMVSNAFGCNYEGPISPERVTTVVSRYLEVLKKYGESPGEICLADTVGLANPHSLEQCVTAVQKLGVPVSLHLHDTRGLGLLNVYVGLQMGIATFESSVGGVGGCPFTPGASGNVATEDVLYLCESLGVETGVDIGRVCQAARLLESIVGQLLPGKIYKTL